jgi:hypothetical protein
VPYVKRHSGFAQDVADIPDIVSGHPHDSSGLLGYLSGDTGRNGNEELGWRSAGAAADAAATLAEALGTILGRKLRAGKQDAGHTLEKTAVTA